MKISFCIPTFNRLNSLKLAVNSIIKNKFEDFEICISDNNSNDGTVEFLKQISSNNIKINYQNKNEGIDANMLSVMKMATGEYIFLLGDDDYLKTECSYELNLIIKKDPALIVFSKKAENKEFINEIDKAYRVIWDKMSFGYIMFKKELIEVTFRSEFLGTYHAYSGWVLDGIQRISKHKKLIINLSSIDIVKTNSVKKSWSFSSFEIYFLGIPEFLSLILISNSEEIYEDYLSKSTSTYYLIQQKAVNNLKFDNKHYEKLKKHYATFNIIKIKFLLSIPFNRIYRLFNK